MPQAAFLLSLSAQLIRGGRWNDLSEGGGDLVFSSPGARRVLPPPRRSGGHLLPACWPAQVAGLKRPMRISAQDQMSLALSAMWTCTLRALVVMRAATSTSQRWT